MTVVKICMLALLGLSASMIVKQWKSDFLPLLRLGLIVLFGGVLIASAAPILSFLRGFGEEESLSPYTQLLFKALGIAILTQLCSDVCRECGESGIAGGVELTGKLEILMLCIPLMEELLKTARALLTAGGVA